MFADFLKTIAQHKLELIASKNAYYENLIKNMRPTGQQRYEIFKKAISKKGQINLIAEIKKASPSAGLIREDFNATQIAGIYIKNKDCLVEVHDEQELRRAVDVGAEIIGVNNRNLKSLKVDLNNCLELIPQIPQGIVIVAESGLKTHEDIRKVQEAGAHAVLIGETFMSSPDIGAKIKEVMYGTR